MRHRNPKDYSSGDCSGLSPDSLEAMHDFLIKAMQKYYLATIIHKTFTGKKKEA
ncbi:hypothetical protein HNQ88_004306 [Aureibacter tunicatorum]|uniref:Uncharacterized protein n=1 Tax=Aureibacter tunicatorum TaxID=866807 RepID=A0AAE4BUX8_9BACT|nr:hypothetical protein [Aureibacter tunicatorum]